MEIKKVILIDDLRTIYQIYTFVSKRAIEINFTLGEVEPIFDFTKYEEGPSKLERSNLLPRARVVPLIINGLDKQTVIILRIRPDHYLYNTTFSPEGISKFLKYDANIRVLNYIFFDFPQDTLMIYPKGARDEMGLFDYFANNLDDNLLRQTILDLTKSPHTPKDTLKNILLERADNSIICRGATYDIKYRGKNVISLNRDECVNDIIYFIKNKVNSDSMTLWKKLRGKDSTDSAGNFIRNKNRFLKMVSQIETDKKIVGPDLLSVFVKNYINIDSKNGMISYVAPPEIEWQFDLPEEFNK